jgi:predicted lipoprotein with Yx(FWY)xxD motif
VGTGAIVSDGSSGAIIAYQTCQLGIGGIFAQHVDSLGAVLWGQEGKGISVCTAAGDGVEPCIVSDGAGGAIIAWADYRMGSADIWAQRVNVLGAVQWASDGVAICAALGGQEEHKIIPDGTGGAIVVWKDRRTGNSDIYAQRVNASGAVQWASDGVPLCTANSDQYDPRITSDGAGGAIIAWVDSRSGSEYDIYAQRVNASGAIQWGLDGAPLCTAPVHQYHLQITSDGAGGAIATWTDSRNGSNYDVYAQRVDASGGMHWAVDGVPVCAAMGNQWGPQVTSDGGGGAIVTWLDWRSGSDYDIRAQRVDTAGVIQWTSDGVPLCTAPGAQNLPQITSDGAGGSIVTWVDNRSGSWDIYAQRVDASGGMQWPADGVPLCTAPEGRDDPRITFDGGTGAIITWIDYRSSSPGIYAQRVNGSGSLQWTPNGVLLCSATGDQESPQITGDGIGGAIVTWEDHRSGNYDICAQRLDARGAILWAVNGIAICTATGDQQLPQIASGGNSGAIVAWEDYRGGSDSDIYAQLVNDSGVIQWAANGVPLCIAMGNQGSPQVTSDLAGGAIVAWSDDRDGDYEYDLYAQSVDASGVIQWPADGVAICTATGDQDTPQIISDGAGGAIVTWRDDRGGGSDDIYAQKVNALGVIQWTVGGVILCTANGYQYDPKIVSDGAGGAIVTWADSRSGNYSTDIYAQRLNASGVVQWMTDGLPLCTAAGDQEYPRITSDGAGGAIVTWSDSRIGSSDIYAQRVDATGATQWTLDGVPLCRATGYQNYPEITSDGAGGAIVTWEDRRNGNADVYAQRINASGTIPDSSWAADGVALCTATGTQHFPQIASDAAGGAVIAWQDFRCGSWVYAQRIRASGEIVATTLQHYSAGLGGTSIRIDWALSEIDEGARFSISRASAPDWNYVALENAAIVKERLSFTFTDTDCLPGTTYKYRVECEAKGTPRRTLFETDEIKVPPLPVTLYQNHPNPFNPQTVIRFYLPEAQEIFLDVYDVAGERVARIAEGKREKGHHEVIWDGRNSSGEICSSGVYFSRLKAGKSTISRKMVIMR